MPLFPRRTDWLHTTLYDVPLSPLFCRPLPSSDLSIAPYLPFRPPVPAPLASPVSFLPQLQGRNQTLQGEVAQIRTSATSALEHLQSTLSPLDVGGGGSSSSSSSSS